MQDDLTQEELDMKVTNGNGTVSEKGKLNGEGAAVNRSDRRKSSGVKANGGGRLLWWSSGYVSDRRFRIHGSPT